MEMNREDFIVTIVISAYNAAPYIRKCLDSVLNQTYKNYAVLIINDGSTDDTEVIVENYMEKFPNILSVFNKENGGLSSARNAGLKLTDSKYIIFIDSDDYIKNDYVETLVEAAEKNQADVVCSGQYRITEDGKIVSHIKYKIDQNGNCVCRHLNMHGKLYRTEYIKAFNIWFPEGKLYEDNSFNIVMFFLTEKIFFLDYEGYYQLVHLNSITTRKIREDDIPFEALEYSIRYLTENKSKVNDYDILEYTVMSFFTYFILEANRKHRYYKLSNRASDKELLDKLCIFAKKNLEKYFMFYYRNKYLKLFEKNDLQLKQKVGVKIFVFLLHKNIIKFFIRFFYKIST